MHGDTHRRRLVVSGVMTPEIVLDINSDSSRNDYPIEVSIADVSAGKVHSWLVRPSANRLCDSQDAEDRKLRGLSKNAFENGETASKVTREILRVLEGRRVVSNDIARDSVARLFAAAHMPSPVFYSAKADDIFATMARIVGRPKNSFEEVLRFRTAVCDRSAAGNAAGCAAVIELVLGNEEIDRDRIERVFGIWGDRARKPSPWRMKLSRLV
ncbi:MAG: hypothetical protein ING19_17340 [Azospirillum sp.]|nr:hypothetical protein [Azospirillum sp.]